ncbi:MAG: phosphoribosylglycinamide formyltransferase [Synechococcaceae cyanobacterium RL_1_2]|nr:phosphoribosylglycinamide formyltransferase [Synechococcaceae cyanobacterium RL_1_2]
MGHSLVSPDLSAIKPHVITPVKLGVLASGSGTNFECVAQAIDRGELQANIEVVIYNNPEAQVKARAKKWGIPCIFLDHRQLTPRTRLDQEIVQIMQAHGVEWVIMAGWMRIVTEVLLTAYPDRVINIHPSLLPSFKGIKAVEQALTSQVKITGCTVHLASLEVDSGKILMQAAVPVYPEDNAETLHQRIQIQEHRIFPAAIALATASGAHP